MAKISFLEQLLGTRTKIRILKIMINENNPLSRNKLAMATGMGVGPVYEQIDQLIALGALRDDHKRVSIDPDFPYLDLVRDLVILTEDHMNDRQTILRSIDRVLGTNYYITGYASACQNGMPIDVDEKCILVMVKDVNTRKDRMLDTIAQCTDHTIKWRSAERIPEDVQRLTLSGAEVWASSVERGVIDSIKEEECGYYPIFLLLVQNVVNRSMDLRKVMEYAEDHDVENIFGSAIKTISDRMADLDIQVGFKGEQDPEVIGSVNLALNTVLG